MLLLKNMFCFSSSIRIKKIVESEIFPDGSDGALDSSGVLPIYSKHF